MSGLATQELFVNQTGHGTFNQSHYTGGNRVDTRRRSAAKSVTWRVVGIVLLGIISYAITGNWKEMTIITILFHSIRLIMYYYHERLWERVSWGKLEHPLAKLPVKEKLTPEDLGIIREKLRSLGYVD